MKFMAHTWGKTKAFALLETVFWPSMTGQIKEKASSCPICNAFCNQQQRETLYPLDIPGLPWEVVGTDLFEFSGHTYLLITDFY